ncbi:MAG: chemotaxis protein CheW [Lachnospiraceae bacterium]|nr:chemotaxis protein CheW [Lachnospiraceae bacterium]
MDQIAVANNEGKNEVKASSSKRNAPVAVRLQYIVIKMGDEQYGIDIRYVDNIVRMQNITRVPKVPAYLKGVINLRGEVIPVVSLRLKMGLPADEYTKNTRIIILKTEAAGNLGIIVDEVREVVTLGEESIEKMAHEPKDSKASFVNGIGKNGGELISLLDRNAITLEAN